MPPVTDAQLYAKLKSVFGYTSFRPHQREVVDVLLAGRDSLVVMPTGGGKSLCYQLPALLLDGMTVVVSPLIALMKDQVDRLQSLGVAATFLNSTLTDKEFEERRKRIALGDIKLLYVAPERLMMPGFLPFITRAPLALFAIDEAHCISEWGHDFRPEYRQLSLLRKQLPGAPIAAFTATATHRVQKDVVSELGLRQPAIVLGALNRANLYYAVRPKQRAFEQLLAYVKQRPRQSGIVYCFTRKTTEMLATRLHEAGVNAVAYHAGLEPEERRQRQEAFLQGKCDVIIATIAFGMGIDKPDVRFVIHYDLPKSLEGYFQESGRAGRDGLPSDCILLYSVGDLIRLRDLVAGKSGHEREVGNTQLDQVSAWAESKTCRRTGLLAYFGGAEVAQPHCCDICERAAHPAPNSGPEFLPGVPVNANPVLQVDYTERAQMLFSCARRTGESFGIAHLIDVLTGSKQRRVIERGHDKLPTFGVGRASSKDGWRLLAELLLERGFMRQEGDYKIVKLTPSATDILQGKTKLLLPAIEPPPVVPRDAAKPLQACHEALFEQLRTLRAGLAEQKNLPAFAVFHDTSLRQMAALLPQSEAAFMTISGVGERKRADYGELFVAAIVDYVQRTGAKPLGLQTETPWTPPELTDSMAATLALYKQGKAPVAIAKERSLSMVTVYDHLATAIESGAPLALDALVPPQHQAPIRAALQSSQSDALKPVFDALGGRYPYEHLRFVRAVLRRDRHTPAVPA